MISYFMHCLRFASRTHRNLSSSVPFSSYSPANYSQSYSCTYTCRAFDCQTNSQSYPSHHDRQPNCSANERAFDCQTNNQSHPSSNCSSYGKCMFIILFCLMASQLISLVIHLKFIFSHCYFHSFSFSTSAAYIAPNHSSADFCTNLKLLCCRWI